MNRDNFWNLVFWAGMVLGLTITNFFDEQQHTAGFISSWLTILGVPLIVSLGSKVSFNKNELTFFNSNGESLKDRRPNGIFIVLTIAITALMGAILDANTDSINDTVATILLFGIFFLVPTLYFIYKNCPIAILFSRHAWRQEINGVKTNTYHHIHSLMSTNTSLKSFTSQNPITDTSYSGCSWNIHNPNHYKR